MSLARIYTTKGPVRKAGLKCGKCGAEIRKGVDRRLTFAVGFRGWEQTRCLKPECYPTMAERESSNVSTVYSAIEGTDIDTLESLEDLESYRDEIVAACEEVADEYESNEMYEINYDLQERADQVRSAGEELEGWSPDNDEPQEEDFSTDEECPDCNGHGTTENDEADCETCEGTGYLGEQEESFEDAHAAWLEETRDSLREAIDSMELP